MYQLVRPTAISIKTMKTKDISLKSANVDDFEYFYSVRKLTMTEHFTRAGRQWGDCEVNIHRNNFDINTVKIIIANGRRVGFIKLVHEASFLAVSHFCIEPEFQNYEIGTSVMKKVLVIARNQNLRVLLNVLIGNRASRLYERLGFKRTCGDDPLLEYYVWELAAAHCAGDPADRVRR